MEWIRILLGPAVSVIILLIGGSIMFGKFKEKCDNNEKKLVKAEKDLSRRVEHLEESNGMTITECNRRSEIYKTLMCGKIDSLEKAVNKSSEIAEKTRGELVKQVNKNRDEFIEKCDIISAFMGETKSIMNLLKTKFLESSP